MGVWVGIFGITSCNIMKYYHSRPHWVSWHTIAESKGIKDLQGRSHRLCYPCVECVLPVQNVFFRYTIGERKAIKHHQPSPKPSPKP